MPGTFRPLSNRMSTEQSKGSRRFIALLITQALALIVCVGVPALVSFIAPVSWVSFERDADGVKARVQTCLLFVVPFRAVVVDPVEAINEQTVAGAIRLRRRTGTDKTYQAEDEGFLLISGPNQLAKVQVSPADLKTVLGKVNAFLEQPNQSELKLFVVANWKFSVLGGGLVSLLTVLYLGGLVFGLLRMVWRAIAR